jgi:hypothetical protein
MTTDALTERLRAAVDELWEHGCPVATRPEETAATAMRRWRSRARRGVQPSDFEGGVRDLVKGLIAAAPGDPRLVGPLKRDYECVARALAALLRDAAP